MYNLVPKLQTWKKGPDEGAGRRRWCRSAVPVDGGGADRHEYQNADWFAHCFRFSSLDFVTWPNDSKSVANERY
jgi:hypothetical protein